MTATASNTARPAEPRGLPPLPDGAVPVCRVMSSEGGPPATADATAWLDVAAKASFSVRTVESGRELRFEGPGRVRPCGDEVALVAEGSAVGLPGTGEAPGAEQWVATACGVARWASGVHRVAATRDGCRMQSSIGALHVYTAEDVTIEEVAVDGGAPVEGGAPGGPPGGPGTEAIPRSDGGPAKDPWRRIDGRRAFKLQARGAFDSAAAVKTSLGACERAAATVQRLATVMTSGDAGGGNVGDMAAESVVARGLARAACAVAAVRVALSGSRPEDQTRLATLNARWRAPH